MRRTSLILLLLAVLVIAVPIHAEVAASAPRIVAVAAENPDMYNLYTMEIDGKNPVKIYTADSLILTIYWLSPDGGTVYFQSDEGIFCVGLDGKNLRPAEFQGYHPQLSPDGKRVVFARLSFSMDSSSLYLMNLDGTSLNGLTEEKKEIMDEDPSWSPDGKRIVFTRNHKLWILDLDSKEQQEVKISDDDLDCYSPRWSKDGSKIAFIGESGINQDIYLADLQTGETTAITDDGSLKRSLLWTPDGTKLAYSFGNSFEEEKSNFYSVDPDGKNKQKLTDGKWDYYQLAWITQ